MRRDLTPGEALEAVLERTPVLGSETVSLPQAQGRILAAPIDSTRQIPPADNSAMDGFAVRRADCAGASASSPVRLPLAFAIPAGAESPPALGAGTAALSYFETIETNKSVDRHRVETKPSHIAVIGNTDFERHTTPGRHAAQGDRP